VGEKEMQTTMRVAGGWVRDKMLGLESDDIDITLSDVSGRDLAKMLEEKGLVKI
jgi:tRNA nucleotidyltransferase (CCA-adding enzyme)